MSDYDDVDRTQPRATIVWVTLAHRRETHNFHVDMTIAGTLSRNGTLIPYTRWEAAMARGMLRRLTRWFKPRTIVSAIDPDTGTITLARQHWSWLRWRWL